MKNPKEVVTASERIEGDNRASHGNDGAKLIHPVKLVLLFFATIALPIMQIKS